MALPVLDATDQRILGSLLEKQRTVPGSYPLSLNSLRLACNQTSSRDPITGLDDATIENAIRDLKVRGLIRVVWAGKGSRALKYHQLLDEVLSLQPDERALVTVLLLRGAQSPGELKTRTERLHPFDDKDEVEQVLRRMAALPEPLVRELPRRAGQREDRWVHLLGPVVEPDGAAAAPSVDREVVLAQGAGARDQQVVRAYDAVADAYFDTLGDELTEKPFDVWLLERIARPGRLEPDRRRRVRPGPPHRVPCRHRRPGERGRPVAGDDRGGRARVSRPGFLGRQPVHAATTTHGLGVGGDRGVVLPGASGRL